MYVANTIFTLYLFVTGKNVSCINVLYVLKQEKRLQRIRSKSYYDDNIFWNLTYCVHISCIYVR